MNFNNFTAVTKLNESNVSELMPEGVTHVGSASVLDNGAKFGEIHGIKDGENITALFISTDGNEYKDEWVKELLDYLGFKCNRVVTTTDYNNNIDVVKNAINKSGVIVETYCVVDKDKIVVWMGCNIHAIFEWYSFGLVGYVHMVNKRNESNIDAAVKCVADKMLTSGFDRVVLQRHDTALQLGEEFKVSKSNAAGDITIYR